VFTFVTLSRGWSIERARPIGVSIDPGLVAIVAERLDGEIARDVSADPALAALTRGRRAALRECRREVAGSLNEAG
jgi:hypothetical protein